MLRNIYIFIISLLAVHAQADNSQGIAFYKAGETAVAKQLFEQQLNGPAADKAVALYYLGEIAFGANQPTDALNYYKQGWEASATYPYNQVGIGKVLLKTDKPTAEKSFETAIKLSKKDAELTVALAAAYHSNGMEKEAQAALDNAKKYNPESPAIFLYEGDVLLAQKKQGEAAAKYEQAIHFDPDCQEAYIKYAGIYQSVTPSLSVEMLQKVITTHPDYLLAQCSLGNVYSQEGYYAKAIEAYNKYMQGGLYSADNIIHYASALFFNKQYAEAGKWIEVGKAKDADNFLLKRLCLYNDFETGAYQKGLDEAMTFFKIPNGKFIWQDYLYYGRLLNEAKQYDESLASLEKSQTLAESSSHPEIYKDIANVSVNNGKENKAIEAYTQYIELAGEAAEASDFYQLGKYYYTAASKDSLTRNAFLGKADSLFAIVQSRVPSSYLGSLWQARTQAMMDPETEKGLAKPHYELCISILEKNPDKYTKELIECYRYLGYYYFLQKDFNQSKSYWNKVMALDPSNEMAKEALNNIK